MKNTYLVKLVSSLLVWALPIVVTAQTQTVNANLDVKGAVKVADSLKVDSGVYLNPFAIPYNASLDTSLGIINGRLVRGPGGGGGVSSYFQKGNGILTTDSLNIGIGANSALWSLTTQYRSRQAYRSQFQSANNIFTAIENGVYIRNLENDTSNGLFSNICLATINNTNTAGVLLNSVSDGVDKAKFTLQVEATPSTGLTNMVEGFSVYSKNSAGNAYGILDVSSMFRLTPRNTSGFTQVDSGSIYYDINTNQPKYYNGTAWVEFSTSNKYQTGIYFDTLGQTANDTVLNLDIANYQAVRVIVTDTINNILVNFDTTAYPATGKIFDFSCEILMDTIYPAPNVLHTANKFQLQFGVEPSLSTFNNNTGQRSDIITYRSSGLISRKRFKVIIANDFRNN